MRIFENGRLVMALLVVLCGGIASVGCATDIEQWIQGE